MNNSNIILIGMSGVGKTTVGKELVKSLDGYSFVDIDEEIEKYSGKTIPEIFDEFGEPFFRVLEKDTIKKYIKNETKQVISIGGGAFEDELSRKLLTENGFVIYLSATSQNIYKRLSNPLFSIEERGKSSTTETSDNFRCECNNRPLLKDLSVEKIESIMSKRIPNYEKAHLIIDTNDKTTYNIVGEILKQCLK